MRIKEIDFKDNSFINLYKSYCFSSKPFDEINPLQTISSLNSGSEEYLQILKESDLSACSIFESWEIPLDKGYQRSQGERAVFLDVKIKETADILKTNTEVKEVTGDE